MRCLKVGGILRGMRPVLASVANLLSSWALPLGLPLRRFAQHLQQLLGWQPKVLWGRYYARHGTCNQCGQCCKGLYLTFKQQPIQSPEAFHWLAQQYPSQYGGFVPLGQGTHGLLFNCQHWEEATGRCGIYHQRPTFCRTYPTEASLLGGGKLPGECSYQFKALQSFTSILQNRYKASPTAR